MCTRSPYKARSAGFTFLELSIVIIIIGLFLTLIIKGTELIQTARFKKTIASVSDITSAVMAFQQKYEALPGDMRNAASRLPGCDASCGGGNGDTTIGEPLAGPVPSQAGTAQPQIETSLFWRHLARADLINNVDPESNLAMPEIGATHPRSPMRGVFSVYNRAQHRHGISVKLTPDGIAGFITPQKAMQLDIMVDTDPDPSRGILRSDGGQGCMITDTSYGNDDTLGYCWVMFTNLNF